MLCQIDPNVEEQIKCVNELEQIEQQTRQLDERRRIVQQRYAEILCPFKVGEKIEIPPVKSWPRQREGIVKGIHPYRTGQKKYGWCVTFAELTSTGEELVRLEFLSEDCIAVCDEK